MKYRMISVIAVVACAVSAMFTSCKDEVDDSDLYTFKGQTVTDYIKNDTSFSYFYHVLQVAKVSQKTSSTLDQLLSARGNYTLFAPTNSAMRLYLDSIYLHQPYQLDTMSQATANLIALNALIDNGNDEPILSTSFNVGAIEQPTANDRHILVNFDTLSGGNMVVVLNSDAHILQSDIEVSNGVIHTVDRVLSPSMSTLPSLLEQTPNMQVFSQLLKETGYADSMLKYRDESYELLTDEYLQPKQGQSWQWEKPSPTHRYYGYTAFVEPDSVYQAKWNIPAVQTRNGIIQNWNEIYDVIKQRCAEAYPNATNDDPTSLDNAVNQFVSYHLLNYRVPYNNLVYHYNELGYTPRIPEVLTLDVWEYYETYGKGRRMFKITQSAKTGRMSINRHCTYDNSFTGNYEELSCDREGVQVFATNGGYTNNALNGYYFPIDDILIYDDDVPNKVLNERIRFNVMAAMPELMTNSIRSVSMYVNANHNIPRGYISGVSFSDQTEVTYINQLSEHSYEGWRDYQGDELLISGQVDFTFKLMPVPFDGTYELRFGMTNQADRIMAQIYFGTDPDNLQAIGLPLDFRVATTSPTIGWIQDTEDIESNLENDKTMRNHGFMKGPEYAGVNTYGGQVTVPLRIASGSFNAIRRIIYTGTLERDKTYYVRCKSVLDGVTNRGLALDYMELVPKWVYSSADAEDIW